MVSVQADRPRPREFADSAALVGIEMISAMSRAQTRGVTLAKMGDELCGIVLGPVTVGGKTFQAMHGTCDARH